MALHAVDPAGKYEADACVRCDNEPALRREKFCRDCLDELRSYGGGMIVPPVLYREMLDMLNESVPYRPKEAQDAT